MAANQFVRCSFSVFSSRPQRDAGHVAMGNQARMVRCR
jgi:hypothetical protein